MLFSFFKKVVSVFQLYDQLWACVCLCFLGVYVLSCCAALTVFVSPIEICT